MRFHNVALAMIALIAKPPGTTSAINCKLSDGKAAILLQVIGFKVQTGIVNVWVYGGNPRDFLVKDKRILRLKFPVPPSGPMEACIDVPGPGHYAIAVHHDIQPNMRRDGDDGLGFSNDPPLSVFHLKPSYAEASFVVSSAIQPAPVILRYRYGLSVRPVAAAEK